MNKFNLKRREDILKEEYELKLHNLRREYVKKMLNFK